MRRLVIGGTIVGGYLSCRVRRRCPRVQRPADDQRGDMSQIRPRLRRRAQPRPRPRRRSPSPTPLVAPTGLLADFDGSVFVSDCSGDRIFRWSATSSASRSSLGPAWSGTPATVVRRPRHGSSVPLRWRSNVRDGAVFVDEENDTSGGSVTTGSSPPSWVPARMRRLLWTHQWRWCSIEAGALLVADGRHARVLRVETDQTNNDHRGQRRPRTRL